MYVAALLRHDVYKSLPRRIRERESVFDCLDSALRQNATGQNERYTITVGVVYLCSQSMCKANTEI